MIAPAVPSAFTPEHRAHFEEHGYVVVPTGIEPARLQAVVDTIFDFLGMDPHRPDDWYRDPLPRGGMVELYQHQSLWDIRQHPRLYAIFRELLGTGRLWVTTDRVSLKPPARPDHPEYAHPGFIHWDVNLETEHESPRFGVQGVVALTDTDEDQGGFQCVPGVHRRFSELVATLTPEERRRNRADLERLGLQAVPIPCRAGDIIIWDRRLLHGNGYNRSSRPRLAQYVSMFPAGLRGAEWRDRRIECWREREAPGPPTFPGDPRRVEQTRYRTAELTPLGRCLLGLDEWPVEVR